MVAPSSTAASKSWLIPIESSAPREQPRRRAPAPRSARSRRKKGRAASVSSRKGGSTMRPSSRSPSRPRSASSAERSSVSGRPNFVSSPARSTWTRARTGRPCSAPIRARRSARSDESTDWTRPKRAAARRALFDCRCPTRCQRVACEVGGGRDLRLRLLDPVLPEVAHAGGEGSAHRLRGMRLADGDEGDVAGRARKRAPPPGRSAPGRRPRGPRSLLDGLEQPLGRGHVLRRRWGSG